MRSVAITAVLALITIAGPASGQTAGPAAQVVAALAAGNPNALEDATGGRLLKTSANMLGARTLNAALVLFETRGCIVRQVKESDPGRGDYTGLVSLVCPNRQSSKGKCYDLGYGFVIHDNPLSYWVNFESEDVWSVARCGSPPAGVSLTSTLLAPLKPVSEPSRVPGILWFPQPIPTMAEARRRVGKVAAAIGAANGGDEAAFAKLVPSDSTLSVLGGGEEALTANGLRGAIAGCVKTGPYEADGRGITIRFACNGAARPTPRRMDVRIVNEMIVGVTISPDDRLPQPASAEPAISAAPVPRS